MRVSFKSLIPVKIYFRDETNGNKQRENELAKKHVPILLADILQWDSKIPEAPPHAIVREKFAKYVEDYKIPTQPAIKNLRTESSVTTITIGGIRYLVTGEDLNFLDRLGREFKNRIDEGMKRFESGRIRCIDLSNRVKETSSNKRNLGIVAHVRKVKTTCTHKNNYKFDNVEFWKLK